MRKRKEKSRMTPGISLASNNEKRELLFTNLESQDKELAQIGANEELVSPEVLLEYPSEDVQYEIRGSYLR